MFHDAQIFKSKILIVDDEPANIRLLKGLLNGKGYACIESITDPRETLESYQEFQPDLVLLDLNMPHLNGLQVLEQINNLDQEYPAPVMILTAQVDRDSRLRALDLGARDFLSKPFDLVELSMRIRNLLEIRILMGHLFRDRNRLKEKFDETVFELAVAMTKIDKQNQPEEKDPVRSTLTRYS